MPNDQDKASASGSSTGRQFGPYVLQDLLGAGGMGEVYRARDTRLNRDVAVKMLSGEFTSDPERLARLAREARLLASLNHPNIAAIYELEQVDGVSGLVLEIVEGETLAARLRDRAIPVDQAMSMAAQIVSALDAAHEAGIIHRDLKPANIKITPKGTVKVLDFGLAKARGPAPATDDGVTTQAAPADATRAGAVMGTPAYMSPEQARGAPVDERTDIWAFGVVLYEMLTGRRPFTGHTTTDTLAAILKEEPDFSRVPARAQRLVRVCLEKDPARRLRSINDARLLLDEAPVVPATRSRWLWPALASLAAVLALAAVFLIPWRRPAADPRPVKFEVFAPAGLTPAAPIISPDGRMLAFVATRQQGAGSAMWVHTLETGVSRQLFQAKAFSGRLFWSPDSRFLAVHADGHMVTTDVTTGAQQKLIPFDGLGMTGAWSRENVILYSSSEALMRISLNGGTPEPVTRMDKSRGEIGHHLPVFLPDGRRFLYLRASPATDIRGIYVGSLDAKPHEQSLNRVLATASGPIYVPGAGSGDAFLLFQRGSTLLSQRFDDEKLLMVGEPNAVADGVAFLPVPGPRHAFASVSETGVLAYQRRSVVSATLVWVDRHGKEVGTFVPEPLIEPSNLRFSPDGRRLALTIDGNLWVYTLGGKPANRLTHDGVTDTLVWSPNGSRLIYESGSSQLLSIAADGTEETPRPVGPPGHYHPNGWSADGDVLIATIARSWDIVTIPASGQGVPSPLVQTPSIVGFLGASLSRDFRWLAYTSNATGTTEVWVRPYPGPGKAERISPAGGRDPVWSKDGRELFYVTLEKRQMMAVRVNTAGPAIEFSAPVELFDGPYLHRPMVPFAYDVTSDGRFLMMKPTSTTTEPLPITVVVNWKPDRE